MTADTKRKCKKGVCMNKHNERYITIILFTIFLSSNIFAAAASAENAPEPEMILALEAKGLKYDTESFMKSIRAFDTESIELFTAGRDRELFNSKNRKGETPLMAAIESGNYKTAVKLIEKGADISIRDRSGNDALRYAVYRGNIDMIKSLLGMGADINSKNNSESTPLMLAIYNGNTGLIKFLIEKGADIKLKNDSFNDALMCAADSPKPLPEIFELLIEKGAGINTRDNENATPLMIVMSKADAGMIKFLIEKGADVKLKDDRGNTALNYAIDTEPLKKRAGNKNGAGKDIERKAFEIFLKNKFEIVKLLIEKGAEVNSINNKGESPIFLAVDKGNLEIIRLLIERGADLNIREKNGKPLLKIAFDRGNKEVIATLQKAGAKQ